MLSVELVQKMVYDDFFKTDISKLVLCVDGICDDQGSYNEDGISAWIEDSSVISNLCEYTFQEVKVHLDYFTFKHRDYSWNGPVEFEVICNDGNRIDPPNIEASFKFDKWLLWNKSYSISQVTSGLQDSIQSISSDEIRLRISNDDLLLQAAGIYYTPTSSENNIQGEIDYLSSRVNEVLEKTAIFIEKIIQDIALITSFDFPEEIKAACNQYLTYFAQFLTDCGIDADTEIKSTVKETLFTVTPRDETES